MYPLLSSRLSAVAALIPPGEIVAEIGTDHAYLPIYLIQSGKASKVIATDINECPYVNALKKIKSLCLENAIDLRLGESLKVLKPGEATVLVIAGVGGNTTIQILRSSDAVLNTVNTLVLNPANHQKDVRKWLLTNGWDIIDEDLVKEQGKYYQIIAGEKSSGAKEKEKEYSSLELEIGPILIKKRHPLLKGYIEKKLKESIKVLKHLEKGSSLKSKERLRKIQKRYNELRQLCGAL